MVKQFKLQTKGIDSACDTEIVESREIPAVLIDSRILNDQIWFAFDVSFNPKDKKAVFFASELPILKNKTEEQLKMVHRIKKIWAEKDINPIVRQ